VVPSRERLLVTGMAWRPFVERPWDEATNQDILPITCDFFCDTAGKQQETGTKEVTSEA